MATPTRAGHQAVNTNITNSPLTGVVVVEIANWIAAPSCGAMLADLGATVIKVEPPTGDSMRYVLRTPNPSGKGKLGDNVDVPFQVDNRGKQSVCIDLNTQSGQRLVRRLIGRADVLTTNLLPERLSKYGLRLDSLRADFPRLIVASLSGWGLSGPDVNRPAFDTSAYFARGGVGCCQ
eukprot:m.101903 g.101903  ORF g.101903 m.101903 type:complete len:178 (+) comp10410_c0_seq3:110-643(+)